MKNGAWRLADALEALLGAERDAAPADPLEVDLRCLLLLLAGALPAAEKWHVPPHLGIGPAPAPPVRR